MQGSWKGQKVHFYDLPHSMFSSFLDHIAKPWCFTRSLIGQGFFPECLVKTENTRAVYYFRRTLHSVLLSPESQEQAERSGCCLTFAHRWLGPAWKFAHLPAPSKISELWLSQHDFFICRQTSSRFHLCSLLSKGTEWWSDQRRQIYWACHFTAETQVPDVKLGLMQEPIQFRHPVVAIAPAVQ